MLGVEGFFIFLIFALITYISFYISKLSYGDEFAPLGIFLCVNLISLTLYHLKLIPLNNLIIQVYLLIVISLFSFILGAMIASPSIIIKGKPIPKRNLSFEKILSKQSLTFFYYTTASLATLGWIYLLINFLSEHSLKQIDALQSNFHSIQYVGYLNLLGILVPPTFCLLYLARHRVTFVSFCYLFSAILGLLLSGIKHYLTISLIVSLLVWSASRPGKIRIKHFLILAVAIFVFMVIYNQFVDIYVPKVYKGSKFPKTLSFLERPYLYTVGSWPAMSAIIQNPPEQPRKGFKTLHFLWKILGSYFKIIPQVPEVNPGVHIGSTRPYNVYSLIGGIYWDYGFLGPIIGCFILGFVSTSLYVSARKYSNWILHLISSIFTYGLFISFFDYYYSFNLIFLMLFVCVFGFSLQKTLPLISKALKLTLQCKSLREK